MLELYIRPLSELPIKNVSQQKQNIIIEKVNAILTAKTNDKQTTVLERELNALVFIGRPLRQDQTLPAGRPPRSQPPRQIP